ncbi:UNVERIFIED_CONTAM: trehalose hydrolase, partial [Prevotella sp. 15_C9]
MQSDKAVTTHLRLWAAEGNTSTTAGGKDKVMWVSRSFENTELLRWPTHVALALNTNYDEFSLIPGKKVQLLISFYT